MTFSELKLCPPLLEAVAGCGYETPTAIQTKAIPPVLEGRDVVGLAQTGTGKTAAFLLPIIQRLSKGPRGRVRALIIAPTRELAGQTHDAAMELGRAFKIRSVAIYGGVGMNPQVQKLRQGAEIVVACPGRLLDHIRGRMINLSHLEVLVLDEADRMLDMGFMPDIRRILDNIPKTRQTLLFSATMPDDIRRLTREILSDPVTVQVSHTAPASSVSHALFPVENHLKTGLLMEILRRTDTDSVLVFTRTKHRAKRVAQQLERSGYLATSLQGDMPQNRRQAALDGFKDGTFQVLVATDIAARGIDVSSISHVINYDMPDTVDAYTHRIGRTGRAAKTGDAFTLVTREDSAMVNTIERLIGSKIMKKKIEEFDYSIPAPIQSAQPGRPARPARPAAGYGRPRSTEKAGKTAANWPNAHAPVNKNQQGPREAAGRAQKPGRRPGNPGQNTGRPRAGR